MALVAGQPASVHDTPTCLRDATIGEAQALLIESSYGMVPILDQADAAGSSI